MRHQFDNPKSTVWTDGDPDRTFTVTRYVVEAHRSEPLFCVRGRDRLAIPAALAYYSLADQALSPIAGGGLVLRAIREDIRAFRRWQDRNPDLLKWPDR